MKTVSGRSRPVLVSAGHVLIAGERRDDANVYHPGRHTARRQQIEPRRIARGLEGTCPAPQTIVPVDAALAYLVDDAAVNHHGVEDGQIIGWLQDTAVSEQTFEKIFFKVGATTGLRQGSFSGIEKSFPFRITDDNGVLLGTGAIQDLLVIDSTKADQTFSSVGDSGGPVMLEIEDGKFLLCGIIIGALPQTRTRKSRREHPRSYVCPIWNIRNHLGIEPLPTEQTP
jgi:hypothetical protein